VLVVLLELQSTWSESGVLAWRKKAQEDTEDDAAQDGMGEAMGVGERGGGEDRKESTMGVCMEEEAAKDEIEVAGAVDTLLAM